MPKSESIFWGIVLLAAVYLVVGTDSFSLSRATTRFANTGNTNQQAAPAGGHYMPDGTWMAGSMGGMGCNMGSGGGGCGCGGGR